jgi:hypothetical protein
MREGRFLYLPVKRKRRDRGRVESRPTDLTGILLILWIRTSEASAGKLRLPQSSLRELI